MEVSRWNSAAIAILAIGFLTVEMKAEGVRMCGRKLADLLNIICERHGGFHAPKVRRTMPKELHHKKTLIELLRPMVRKSTAEEEEESTVFTDGVVDECCRKQCSLTTLASYCALPVSSQHLEEILAIPIQPTTNANDNEMASSPNANSEERPQESLSSPAAENDIRAGSIGYSSRPNLGLFSRDRPVFIILSQIQDDEDHLFGEYRF